MDLEIWGFEICDLGAPKAAGPNHQRKPLVDECANADGRAISRP
jgi:hypothetical protein